MNRDEFNVPGWRLREVDGLTVVLLGLVDRIVMIPPDTDQGRVAQAVLDTLVLREHERCFS